MTVSNAPDRDVVLTVEERVAWDQIERTLRSAATRRCVLIGSLRRFGHGFVLSFASLYLPSAQVPGPEAY